VTGVGGTSGAGSVGGAIGTGGTRATGGAAGTAGTLDGGEDHAPDSGMDTPPVRPLLVDPQKACNCELKFSAKSLDPAAGSSGNDTHAGDPQSMKVDPTKKMQGKLVIVLGGIGGGPGPGGIYGYAISRGFHAFLVATQTATSSAPDQYKNAIKTNPMDAEANRQVGDARMEAWDGVDRVSWLDVKAPDSIARRTELALKHAQAMDAGGDWIYYHNADGSVRWSDVFMVGYSFGSQTIAMDAKYVRFGRVLTTSGPQDEGFPNAAWIQHPSATPPDRMYMMVGGTADYPPASGDVGNKIDTVRAAGWIGDIANVHPGAAGPFGHAHLLVLVGQGHSEMCAGDGGTWKAICDYGFGIAP
jgi:hypothetical protein